MSYSSHVSDTHDLYCPEPFCSLLSFDLKVLTDLALSFPTLHIFAINMKQPFNFTRPGCLSFPRIIYIKDLFLAGYWYLSIKCLFTALWCRSESGERQGEENKCNWVNEVIHVSLLRLSALWSRNRELVALSVWYSWSHLGLTCLWAQNTANMMAHCKWGVQHDTVWSCETQIKQTNHVPYLRTSINLNDRLGESNFPLLTLRVFPTSLSAVCQTDNW